MPSPFPGMDPYLEHPALWPGVHNRLITYLGDRLTELLPPRYLANISERVSIDEPERDLYPDAAVLERRTPAPPPSRAAPAAAVCDPPWLVDLQPEEAREPFIEIVSADDAGRVVTVIEVLSPTNKAAGSRGRELYRAKQRQVLGTPAHLLEIDLLRAGEHTVAAPRERLARRGPYHYLVSLSRADRRGVCEVWGVPLRARLPRVAVPLLEGDADVAVDLHELVTQCYDRGGYARRLDYAAAPAVPLPPADDAWADTLLRERGLRA